MLKAARSMLTYPASPLRGVEADAVLGLEAAAVEAELAVVETEPAVTALEDMTDPKNAPPEVLELAKSASPYGTTTD